MRSCVNIFFELNDDYTLTTSMNHYTCDAMSVLQQIDWQVFTGFHPPAVNLVGLQHSLMLQVAAAGRSLACRVQSSVSSPAKKKNSLFLLLDSYFAVVVYKVLILLVEELGGSTAFLERFSGKPFRINTGPCCCCCCCLPRVPMSRCVNKH